jgi:hypothetical protein
MVGAKSWFLLLLYFYHLQDPDGASWSNTRRIRAQLLCFSLAIVRLDNSVLRQIRLLLKNYLSFIIIYRYSALTKFQI